MLKKLATIFSFPVFLLAARFVPFDRLPSTCPFLHITGYPCPTCGMTRSVMSFTRFHFYRSLIWNPLGPLFVAMLALWWINALITMRTGHQTRLGKYATREAGFLAISGMLLLFACGAVRIWILAH